MLDIPSTKAVIDVNMTGQSYGLTQGYLAVRLLTLKIPWHATLWVLIYRCEWARNTVFEEIQPWCREADAV